MTDHTPPRPPRRPRAPETPPPPAAADPNSLLLGRMSGELGQVMTALTTLSGKVDTLAREVFGLGPLTADIHEIKTKVEAIETRIRTLEQKQTERDGRDGLLAFLFRSPALGWLAGAGAATWAILSGKVHP